jgi:hypothetical protein
VACGAEGNQILLGVLSGLAAKLFVMNFEIGHRAARLASPAITAEHVVTKLVVRVWIQAQAWLLGSKLVHEAFSVA